MSGCGFCGVGPDDECSLDCPSRGRSRPTMSSSKRYSIRTRDGFLWCGTDDPDRAVERRISLSEQYPQHAPYSIDPDPDVPDPDRVDR